jgi:hypothetical protein
MSPEVTASIIVLMIAMVWFCWLTVILVGWTRNVWRARRLSGWEWVAVLTSGACLVVGFIVYRPAYWWETLVASILLLGMVWTPILVVRWAVRKLRSRFMSLFAALALWASLFLAMPSSIAAQSPVEAPGPSGPLKGTMLSAASSNF